MPLRRTIAVAALLAAALPAGAAPARLPEHPFDALTPLALPGGQAHASYRRAPWRWPTRRLTYYNAARANAGAVRSAVRAWNKSGVRLRFVAGSRRRARIVIRYQRSPGCVPAGVTGTSYDRRTGRAVHAEVRISRPVPTDIACSRWALTLVTAHELGHALGLGPRDPALRPDEHDARGLSPARCKPAPLEPWRWRCRVLERDDVRGAVRIYGGRVKRRGRAVCDLFAPPATPGALAVVPDGLGGLTASFARPPTREPPPHVLAGPGSYVVAYRLTTCPTAPDESGAGAVEGPWTVPDGGIQQAPLHPFESGRYCIAAWARDGVGRLSRKPATTFADLTLPALP